MMDPELADYCERLEHEFFRLKGRPGMLSPADFSRAREWYEAGIPLAAALEGIGSAFASMESGRGRGEEEVNGLAFCEPFVERAMARRGAT